MGLLFALAGGYLLQRVSVGRSDSVTADTKKFISAIVSGNAGEVKGLSTTTLASGSSSSSSGNVPLPLRGEAMLQEMHSLANGKPYRMGATGPDAFDCSGLVWRALKSLNIYTGDRFTTSTFESIAPKFATRLTAPEIMDIVPEEGDIVIWPGKHMGVVDSGSDKFFSAYSTAKGCIISSISANTKYLGEQPDYWRLSD